MPPEKIQRLNVLLNKEFGGSLLNGVLGEKIDFVKEEDKLELSHILRVHDFNYVMKIMRCCSKASKSVCCNHRMLMSRVQVSVMWTRILSCLPRRLSKLAVLPRLFAVPWILYTRQRLRVR